MPNQFSIGVDWRRKGVICWEALQGDALNILPQPLRYSTLVWRSNTASSISRQVESTDYGTLLFAVQTGTGSNNGFVLGQSDVPAVNTIPVSPSSSYSVSARVKGISSYIGVPLILRVKDQTGATLATSSPLTLGNAWQKLSVSFSTGGSSSHIYIEVIKDNDATNTLFYVTGFMLVAGSLMPAGYNAGSTVDLYDNISKLVMQADWFLGFQQPYQDMPHNSTLRLTVNNSDKRFSPEYAPGGEANPLEGYVLPLRPMMVRSSDGTTIRTHWTGWLESATPSTNQYGERTAQIKASGPERFFANVETRLAVQENQRTDAILEKLLAEVPLPPALTMTTLPDVTGYSEINSNAWISGSLEIPYSLDQGKTTLAYAADNWTREGQDGQLNSFNVYRAMKDVLAAERGRFFFNREGEATFWNRHKLIMDKTVQASFNNTMQGLDYDYASQGELANEVRVNCHPRSISAGDNDLLWTLEEPITLEPEEERQIGAAYRDETDNRIGGRNVTLSNVSFSTEKGFVAGVLVFEKVGANKATLWLRNLDKKKKVKLETAELHGQKITDFGQAEAYAVDHASKSLYGHREMRLDLNSVDKLNNAQAIADFELLRRKMPAGKVQSLTLRSHGKDGGNSHTQQLARTIGDRITIIENQTGHEGDYFIIGEEHKLRASGTEYETKWYLESATEGNWCVIGSSSIDAGAVLLPY